MIIFLSVGLFFIELNAIAADEAADAAESTSRPTSAIARPVVEVEGDGAGSEKNPLTIEDIYCELLATNSKGDSQSLLCVSSYEEKVGFSVEKVNLGSAVISLAPKPLAAGAAAAGLLGGCASCAAVASAKPLKTYEEMKPELYALDRLVNKALKAEGLSGFEAAKLVLDEYSVNSRGLAYTVKIAFFRLSQVCDEETALRIQIRAERLYRMLETLYG